MNDGGQSHNPLVPAKPTNKAASAAAELVEERGLAEGNTDSPARSGHRAGIRVPGGLDRVRQVAVRDKKVRFTALFHHVTVDLFREGFKALRRGAAPGVDGTTWEAYERNLESNLQDLHGRLHRGAYRAKPSRRAYIPTVLGYAAKLIRPNTTFHAAWRMVDSQNGISARTLRKSLGIDDYRLAFRILHRLRRVIVDPDRSQLVGPVEVDDIYVGGNEPGVIGRETRTKSLVGGGS